MKKSTTVKNLITETKETYYNEFTARYNLISSILLSQGKCQMNWKQRNEIEKRIEIKQIPHKGKAAFLCEEFNLFSYQSY